MILSNTMANNLAFPTIYLLPTHFDSDDLAKLESQIPTLTYDINEAEVILGKVARKPRALLELRSRKLLTEEVQPEVSDPVDSQSASQPPAKRRKLSASAPASVVSGESTASGNSDKDDQNGGAQSGVVKTPSRTKASRDSVNGAEKDGHSGEGDNTIVKVVRLPWFTDSLAKGEVLPVDNYLVYQGQKKEGKPPESTPPRTPKAENILRRARMDENGSRPASQKPQFDRASTIHHPRSTTHRKRPHFVQETTSEHEISQHLPPIPDYLHTDYSCQRPTPLTGRNDAFVEQLKKMRTIRTLEGDEVGVRAYSTSIAAVAAYPYPLLSPAGKA